MTKLQKIVELKKLMLKHKLSQQELARVSMREYQTIRAWLCGSREIPDETFQLLKFKLQS